MLSVSQLQTTYLDAWLEGMTAFNTAHASEDTDALDSIDNRLAKSIVTVEDETGHPLDRLGALGFCDGYKGARSAYSDAMKAAPWLAVAPRQHAS